MEIYARMCINACVDNALISTRKTRYSPAYPESSCPIWTCAASQEALGSLVFDERVVAGPSGGAAPAADIAEGAALAAGPDAPREARL
jgi:hypothetical protein